MNSKAWEIHNAAARALAKPDDVLGSVIWNAVTLGGIVLLMWVAVC